ncbi:MAG: hypothetical protein QF515_18380 [Pseudomonadales bacterium]|jgi:hypothetical protein|nr:hypothetical protein [Pseudomonadales bacterium]|tara:strand:+ start:663 stop:1328 length:666 start_codon:yes stop_codon:yes gene_type:complete
MKTEFRLDLKANVPVSEFAQELGARFEIADLVGLQHAITRARLLINNLHFAERKSTFREVSRDVKKILHNLEKSAWTSKSVATALRGSTQAHLLAAELERSRYNILYEETVGENAGQKRSINIAGVYVEMLEAIEKAASVLHEELSREQKGTVGSPGKPLVKAAVRHLVAFWAKSLERPLKRPLKRVPVSKFVCTVMEHVATLDGVQHELTKIFRGSILFK